MMMACRRLIIRLKACVVQLFVLKRALLGSRVIALEFNRPSVRGCEESSVIWFGNLGEEEEEETKCSMFRSVVSKLTDVFG